MFFCSVYSPTHGPFFQITAASHSSIDSWMQLPDRTFSNMAWPATWLSCLSRIAVAAENRSAGDGCSSDSSGSRSSTTSPQQPAATTLAISAQREGGAPPPLASR